MNTQLEYPRPNAGMDDRGLLEKGFDLAMQRQRDRKRFINFYHGLVVVAACIANFMSLLIAGRSPGHRYY